MHSFCCNKKNENYILSNVYLKIIKKMDNNNNQTVKNEVYEFNKNNEYITSKSIKI